MFSMCLGFYSSLTNTGHRQLPNFYFISDSPNEVKLKHRLLRIRNPKLLLEVSLSLILSHRSLALVSCSSYSERKRSLHLHQNIWKWLPLVLCRREVRPVFWFKSSFLRSPPVASVRRVCAETPHASEVGEGCPGNTLQGGPTCRIVRTNRTEIVFVRCMCVCVCVCSEECFVSALTKLCENSAHTFGAYLDVRGTDKGVRYC